MSFDGDKLARQSRGILGPAFAIIVVVSAQIFDVEILPDTVESVIGGVEDILVTAGIVIGSVVGIIGRIRASDRISVWF